MEAKDMDLREESIALAHTLKGVAAGLYGFCDEILLGRASAKDRREVGNLLRETAKSLDDHALLDDPDGNEMPAALDSKEGRYRPAERGREIDIPSAGPELPLRLQDSPVKQNAGDPVE